MKYFQNKYDYLILTLGLLILSLIIFFPVSSDLATFIQGGMILKNGGALYVDYFDVKPPFVYYFFEFLYSMFGKNITLYRLFDFAYQTVFLLSSIYIFNKLELNKIAIRLFSVLMPMAYTTLSFPHTFQVESLLFLPLIWYYYIGSKSLGRKYDNLIKGVLLGITINLKYTFGILLLADILYMIIQKKSIRSIIKQSVIQLFIALAVTALLFSPILISGNFHSFLDFFNYMKEYSNYPALGFNWLQASIKFGTGFFTDHYSIILLLAALYTIFYIGLKDKEIADAAKIKGLIVFFLVLYASVIIERKMLIYHQQRILPFLVFLSSMGLALIYSEIRNYKKSTLVIALFVVTIFSPIPRLINLLNYPINVISQGSRAFYSTLTEGTEGQILKKHFAVADYINANTNTDKVLLINTGGNEMICYFDSDYKYSFPQSAFYLNDKAPEYLKEKAFDNIKDTDVIILQNNDQSHIMFFNDDTSLSSIQKNLVIWDYITTNFKQDTIIEDNFIIYKRNPSN
ncbi:MAG: hypothetical protein CVV25_02690 [Ignavibacteriae bacterium HGW-Ignavibacteriae-4]|jgi:hypothetical protein|nr:MAG: hypothetical protein CVV25_02690 [Ignavibacteriae bacterium HGW-Ignavibacteriae-4]